MTNDFSNTILAACAANDLDLSGAPAESDQPSSDLLSGLITAESAYAMNIPDREWIVDDLIPVGTLTLMTGAGGDGKTLIAQQLATCVAGGKPVWGCKTKQVPVLGLFAEDDMHELSRRQQAILRVEAIDPAAVGDYRYKSLATENAVLGTFDRYGAFCEAQLLMKIRATIVETGSRLVILDNLTQMYTGDHNDRAPVTAFLRALSTMAAELKIGVLLLGHIAKSEGSTYAGSASWRDSVRSLLTITRGPNSSSAARQPYASDIRTLTVTKSNYAATGKTIMVRYDSGAFVSVDTVPPAIPAHAMTYEQGVALFLDNLEILTRRQMHVSDCKTASNFAPKIMAKEFGADSQAMERALVDLLRSNKIIMDEMPWTTAQRKRPRGLVVPPHKAQVDSILDVIHRRPGQ